MFVYQHISVQCEGDFSWRSCHGAASSSVSIQRFVFILKFFALCESLYRNTTSVAEMVLQRDANIHLFMFEVHSLVEREITIKRIELN